jgi:predicted nucleic acid-binding protein
MKVLLDSNILIRWLEPQHPDQILVQTAMDRILAASGEFCYTLQNVSEFWNALTRPLDRNGYGLTPEEADLRVRAFEFRLTFLTDTPDVYLAWRRLLVEHAVRGVQVHDARLVASMLAHGVEKILTFNTRDFARYTQIEAIHPSQVPAA